jgi:ketosteroid isomerase-like protein
MVDRAAFAAWIEAYERLWRAPGTAGLRELFTADATYLHSPYEDPIAGLAAIEHDWETERDGAGEAFTMAARVVAVDGDTGVAKVLVRYGDPVHQEYLDLWLVRFAADGRCSAFEEWPFWPDQAWHAAASGA